MQHGHDSKDATTHGAVARLAAAPRALTLAALVALTIICWIWLAALVQHMPMTAETLPAFRPWSWFDFTLMFAMWWVMMIGMMTPSAAPMILIFERINDNRRRRAQSFVASSAFAAGYLGIWGLFSLLATLAQWVLESTAMMLPMGHFTTALPGAIVLLIAGLYQFTPLKQTCLRHCRSPFAFVINHWRDGRIGAVRMGLWHGSYCLGCCWLLMLLLFVGGVMNLLWVGAIAAFVLAEKLLPAGQWIGRAAGIALIGSGAWLLLGN